MKIAKKALSVFLSLLMVFTACAVGLPGLVLLADAAESKYTHEQVIDLVNAATASGFDLSSEEDKWEYTADDGSVIAAAEAIFDYAVKMYRAGKAADAAGNSSAALYNLFKNEFSGEYVNATAADRLVKNVLYPDGTTVYSYDSQITKDNKLAETETEYTKGTDVTDSYPLASNLGYYAQGATSAIITKTVDIQLDLTKYLFTFDSIDDIPASFISSVKYTYAHANGTSATVSDVTSRNETSGSGCNETTTTYYTPTITTAYWNYMSAKPMRTVVKDKSTKKQLLNIEKFFDAERLATTFDAMLEMSNDELATYYATANSYYDLVKGFSKTVIDHFNLNYDGIVRFMEDLEFAHRIVAGKYSIDMLLTYIGSDYDEESYSKMSALYTKVSAAYNVVDTMSSKVADYIVANGYADKYNEVQTIKADAKAYIDTLHAVMTEQRLEELVDSMLDTYDDYYSLLDKENIEEPSDAEIVSLDQKVDGYNNTLKSYSGYSYYRNYYTTAIEAQWNDFCAKLDDVAAVRDIKISFQTYYDYFMPLLFTTMIADLDDDAALDLHENFQANVDKLVAAYDECKTKWGETIANKIFTLSYDGQDYLLQNLVVTLSKAELEANLVDRIEGDIDAVSAKSGIEVVDFDNFADIKSVLSHFNYDLYNYVTKNNLGLSADYVSKYAEVQKLLDRYHAFTSTSGKDFFDDGFTFADESGIFATRYAGSQFAEVEGEDENGNPVITTQQIGYPNDIVRDGSDDNYVVTEEKLVATVEKIDSFITSRDFGALVGFVDEETEETADLKTYVNQMLSKVLYTNDLVNTLVGAIFPMLVTEIEKALIDGISGDVKNDNPAASAKMLINERVDIIGSLGFDIATDLYIYLDDDLYNGSHNQRYYYEVFESAGLYIYPCTLAKSLAISNPAFYGVGTEIYETLMAAGSDWSKLVATDNPDTIDVDETKALAFDWGVSDRDTFLDTISCVLDTLLPLLQVLFTGVDYAETLTNAAYAKSGTISLGSWGAGSLAAYADLDLTIKAYNAKNESIKVYDDIIVPLFEILGIEKYPTLSTDCSADEIVSAVFGTLLDRVDEILDSPISTVLEILPNLVYFLSMDSVQEIINDLNLDLKVAVVPEIDSSQSDGVAKYAGGIVVGMLDLNFGLPLVIRDRLDLFDTLGFEITNFNEVLEFALTSLSESGTSLKLPPINQQEIIFCSEWTETNGKVDLVANKGDMIYWFIDYLVSALANDGFLDALIGLIGSLGAEDGAVLAAEESATSETLDMIIDKIVAAFVSDTDSALAALVEIINPVTYDQAEMDWVESTWNYNGIEGANNMSVVYLNYGNDWTQDKADYLADNIDSIVSTVLDMTGMEIDDLGAYLQDKVNGFFTNENITSLVEKLGGLGDSVSAVIGDIVKNQIGIDLNSWFVAFGYLFPEGTWAADAEIIKPTDRHYINNFGVEGVANEDGTISWSFNNKPLVDGDGYAFINILTGLLGEASIVIDFLFAGGNIAAFEDLLTLKGYESYETTLGLLFTVLGVENLPTQADFNADVMGSFTNMLMAVLDWFYALTNSDNMIAQLIDIIPDLFYYIESNGLSVLIRNLLMPILVLVDTVRPLVDVDLNGVVSLLISDLLNYRTINLGVILEYVLNGTYSNNDPEYTYYSVDIKNLTLSDIIKIADQYLGTNLYESGLVSLGIKGLCSGIETVENTTVGTIKRTTVTAADTLTIIITALIECFAYPTANGSTNGDVLFGFIAEKTGNEKIANIYNIIFEIIAGIDVEYDTPNWGYMFESSDLFELTLPPQSIIYLDYSTDWTEDAATATYEALDEILDLVLSSLLGENETIATLLNGVLEDNVYTDANLNAVVELIVNAIAGLDATLRDTIDVVVDTDIASWFTMCEYNEETEEYECTKAWGVDNASDKKAAFVAGIKEVLTPANELLAWLFFGADYAFFTGSETNEDGEYIYNDLITIAGGEGYAYGLAPILEVLGCTLAAPETFYDEEAKTYNVGAAVDSILNSVLALVDEISANPAEEVINLLPNLIYFINADGLKVSISNLLAPVNAILDAVSDLTGGVMINTLLEKLIGFDITDISMDTLLGIAADAGLKLNQVMVDIICNLYVGNLAEFVSVNGNKAYKLDVTGYEGDVLTIILSIVLDVFKETGNNEILIGLLGEDAYNAIVNLLNITEAKAMQKFDWLYTEYADSDEVFSAIDSSLRYENAYDIIWTEEMAEYISDNLVDFTTKIIALLGLEINGYEIKSIDDLFNSYLDGDLYTQATADSLLDVLKNLSDLFGDYAELGNKAIKIVDNAIGTSMGSWATMEVTVEDGNKESFIAALEQMFAPIVPLLDVLLCGEDLTFFYSSADGSEQITIPGSEGYAYGIIPLFEALGCTMLTPDEFYALEDDAKIGAILNSLLDRVDEIMLDPVNEIFAMLPAIIYFINSNGLDTSVNNIVNTVDTVLAALEPILGAPDLMSLLGIDLAEYDFNYIAEVLADAISESTGMETEALLVDAVAELTMGKVVSYQSANGETYYTMVYANDEQLKDMVTVVLRLAVDFISTAENADAIAALIVGNTENEEAAKSARTLISLVLQGLGLRPATSGSMAAIYYIFYGLKQGVDVIYDNYYDSWSALLNIFKESDTPVVDKLVSLIGGILGDFAGFENGSEVDNCKCSCHSKNAVVALIHTILNIIRRIFRQTEYQYCACGVDHWDFASKSKY